MINRREFLQLLQGLSVAGIASACTANKSTLVRPGTFSPSDLYDSQERGCSGCDVRLIHITDTHAQLLPAYFREPAGGHPYLSRYGQVLWQPGGGQPLGGLEIEPGGKLAYALSSSDFEELAVSYGKTGGYAHIATLIEQLRTQAGPGRCLLLDGGDSWQGSATALWSQGRDMLEANNMLGIDYMTAHWEFTLGAERFNANLENFAGTFLAQNILLRDEARFESLLREPDDEGRVFTPWQLREIEGNLVAVIGQAYPYTSIAHPGGFTPQWTFAIHDRKLDKLIRSIREQHPGAAVVLLSHNGLGLDLQLAERVSGIDLILGGHTHDPVFGGIRISNRQGSTLVTNGGCAGKFVNVCDLKFSRRGFRSAEARLLPVLSNFIKPDAAMQALVDRLRRSASRDLGQFVAELPFTLYRRGNYNGTVDELILRALAETLDAPICFSPGFRWGNTVLAGETVTMEDVYSWTAITYPHSHRRQMTGREIRSYLEDVADNLFNRNAFLQQGGDMVRSFGISYQVYPGGARGSRISDLRLASGEPLDANKSYTVAGWADARSPDSERGADMAKILRDWLLVNYSFIDEIDPFRPLMRG